jgi:hypothetical protein
VGSLRHRFGSELAIANVPPKVAQDLMRHSTITLTMDRYSHVGLNDSAGALDKLPPLPGCGHSTEATAGRATGTDGKPISRVFARYLPTGRDGRGRFEAVSGGMKRIDEVNPKASRARELTVTGGGGRREAPGGFEPPVEVLQTSALPLGYGAGGKRKL